MTDRRSMFFMAFGEVDEWLAEVADRLVIAVGEDRSPQLLDRDDPVPSSARMLYVGLSALSCGEVVDAVANPGRFGWVRFNVPRVLEGALLKTQLDIRTQWIDHDFPDGVKVFDSVVKPLRRRLTRPTWAWTVGGGPERAYRDVAFTAGALELFDGGTAWMQEGVANVRYGPRPVSAVS